MFPFPVPDSGTSWAVVSPFLFLPLKNKTQHEESNREPRWHRESAGREKAAGVGRKVPLPFLDL